MNAKDNDGYTALMVAAVKNDADVARLLIAAKADVNAKTNGGSTALMIAAMENAADVARLLRDAGAR